MNPNRRSMIRGALLATLAVPFTLGCSGTAASDGASSATPTAQVAAVETATGTTTPGTTHAPTVVSASIASIATGMHGPARRVAEALAEVSLRDDQRADLETLGAAVEAQHAAAAAAHQDLAEALALQIEDASRMKLDRVALEPKLLAVTAAWASAQPKERAAFESLHTLLDASQRAELVTALQSHGEQRDHGDPRPAGRDKTHGHGPGQRWADDLELSDIQRVAFFEILREGFTEAHANMGEVEHAFHHAGRGHAILEAFKGETFSFDAVAPAEDLAARAATKSGRLFDTIEKVLVILTPEQRTLAAAKIREHGALGPMMAP